MSWFLTKAPLFSNPQANTSKINLFIARMAHQNNNVLFFSQLQVEKQLILCKKLK